MLPFLKHIERQIALKYAHAKRRNVLRVFAFHAICPDEGTRAERFTHPHYTHTLDEFAFVLDFCANNGFRFVSLADFDLNFRFDAPCIALTFDDGYANQMEVLPLLEKFNAPATFFIPTQFVQNQKKFWWDVLWQMGQYAYSDAELVHKESVFAQEISKSIHDELNIQLNPNAFIPNGTDRVMNEAELCAFSTHPLVHIGNHTHTHRNLSDLPASEIHKEIEQAQSLLEKWCGNKILPMLAYPNGAWNQEVCEIMPLLGMNGGFTTQQAVISDLKKQCLTFPRYSFRSDLSLTDQLRYFTSDFSLAQRLRRRF